MARARTLPEVARLQAHFMQQQIAVANAQTRELLELSAKISKQTLETGSRRGTSISHRAPVGRQANSAPPPRSSSTTVDDESGVETPSHCG
jgi:hypothetical protein